MRLKDWSWRFVVVFALTLASCGDDDKDTGKDEKIKSGRKDKAVEMALDAKDPDVFQITNSRGTPLAGAAVLIGSAEGKPFTGNKLQTDANGLFRAPKIWSTPQTLTIEKAGYIRTTFIEQRPQRTQLKLEKQDSIQRFEISGDTIGYNSLGVGKIDFALVLPLVNKQKLAQFEMSQIISSEIDNMSVFGKKIELPSNLSVPNQRLSSFLPFTFGKPNYRIYVQEPGSVSYVAVHGRFDLSSVRNQLSNGKSIFDIVNSFEFLSAGTATANVVSPSTTQDISVQQTPFSDGVTMQAPPLTNSELMVSFAMVQEPAGLLVTDLKRLYSNQVLSLKIPRTNKPKFALSILKRNTSNTLDFRQLSFSLDPAQNAVSPQFIPLIAPPELVNNVLTLFPPQRPSFVKDIGTYLCLVEVEEIGRGSLKTERRTRLWEIYAPQWISSIDLPTLPFARNAKRIYRWEVLFLGQQGDSTSENVFDRVTHLSRHSLDI